MYHIKARRQLLLAVTLLMVILTMLSGCSTVGSTVLALIGSATPTPSATLAPTATVGTAVTGTLSVVDSTDWGALDPAVGAFESFNDFHDFAYAYTVGS